jgi:hypothetical protein
MKIIAENREEAVEVAKKIISTYRYDIAAEVIEDFLIELLLSIEVKNV